MEGEYGFGRGTNEFGGDGAKERVGAVEMHHVKMILFEKSAEFGDEGNKREGVVGTS